MRVSESRRSCRSGTGCSGLRRLVRIRRWEGRCWRAYCFAICVVAYVSTGRSLAYIMLVPPGLAQYPCSCSYPCPCPCPCPCRATRRPIFFCPLRASSSHQSTALTYPVALEAILTAEVGLLAQLLASRALQAASIFIAVRTLAFALLVDGDFFCRCLVHVCGMNLGDRFGREIRRGWM